MSKKLVFMYGNLLILHLEMRAAVGFFPFLFLEYDSSNRGVHKLIFARNFHSSEFLHSIVSNLVQHPLVLP